MVLLDINMRGGKDVKSNNWNQISAVSATVLLMRIVSSVPLLSSASGYLPATAVSDNSTKTTTLIFSCLILAMQSVGIYWYVGWSVRSPHRENIKMQMDLSVV